jgi:hypothetical protein
MNKITLIHMQSENGRVAMMSRMETKARRRAQQPGPSGSAEIIIKMILVRICLL